MYVLETYTFWIIFLFWNLKNWSEYFENTKKIALIYKLYYNTKIKNKNKHSQITV